MTIAVCARRRREGEVDGRLCNLSVTLTASSLISSNCLLALPNTASLSYSNHLPCLLTRSTWASLLGIVSMPQTRRSPAYSAANIKSPPCHFSPRPRLFHLPAFPFVALPQGSQHCQQTIDGIQWSRVFHAHREHVHRYAVVKASCPDHWTQSRP